MVGSLITWICWYFWFSNDLCSVLLWFCCKTFWIGLYCKDFLQKAEKLNLAHALHRSPLDKIRSGKIERAAQFGITSDVCSNSFDANQSFPKATMTMHKDQSPVLSRLDSIGGWKL